MNTFVEMLVVNAIGATILALVVALIAWRLRRPALVHLLWLVVLLKLVTPPVFELDTVSAWQPVQEWLAATNGAVQSETAPPHARSLDAATVETSRTRPESSSPSDVAFRDAARNRMDAKAIAAPWIIDLRSRVWDALPLLWLSGTLTLLTLYGWRWWRFRSQLGPERPVSQELRDSVDRLAQALHLRRPPRIRMLPGAIPPSLWLGPRGSEMLLPEALLQRLSNEERDTLLAHELAHARRRDHWVRLFEMLVIALFWWHPVAWWARRNLRLAEEQACDALVLATFDKRPRVYAESLIKTVEFLARSGPAVPSLATGATGTARLKERLTMILHAKNPRPLPRLLRPLVYGALLVVLLVSPAWVDKVSSADKPEASEHPERQHHEQMLTLQQQEMELQREMQRLEQERMKLRMQMDEKALKQQLEQARREIQQLLEAGETEQVEQLRREMARAEAEAALRLKEFEIEQFHLQKRLEVEHQLQDLVLRQQRAELEGDLNAARDLQQEIFEMEKSLRNLELEGMKADIERQRERLELEKRELDKMGR